MPKFPKVSFSNPKKNDCSEPPSGNQCFMLVFLVFFIFILISTTGCTISFSNVMTSGEAQDVGDDSSKAEASPDITVPVKGL